MKKITFILFVLLSSVLVIKAGLTDEEITLEPLRARNMVIQASILDRVLEPGKIVFVRGPNGRACYSRFEFDPIPNIVIGDERGYRYAGEGMGNRGVRVEPLTHMISVFAQKDPDLENQASCRAGIQSIIEAQKLIGPMQLLIYVRE